MRLLAGFCLLFCCFACGDDDLGFPVPDSYRFDNVDYAAQTQTLGMLSELADYAKTAATSTDALNENRLATMYANQPGAGWAGTYADEVQLRNQTFEVEQGLYDNLLIDLASATQFSAGNNAEPGRAGVVTTADGAKRYFVNANGVEYAQVIEKGLMGAAIYYQAVNEYLGADRQNVDNEEVIPGQGTAMENAWDRAFGYWGVPVDFPADKDGLLLWGKYANDRDPILGCNETMMDAFLRGRAAISAGELGVRNEALNTIRTEWERVSVATALHYLNEALTGYDDAAVRLHALSEAAAFIYVLKFNTARNTVLDNIDGALVDLGGNRSFRQMNFYNTTRADVEQVRDNLADYYNLTDRKSEF